MFMQFLFALDEPEEDPAAYHVHHKNAVSCDQQQRNQRMELPLPPRTQGCGNPLG